MKKVDFKKELKYLYRASAKKMVSVEVPGMNFLMIDGKGNPNTSQAYKEAVEALFALSYTIKFNVKKGPLELDYGVMPLEGLWWSEDITKFAITPKEEWYWTAMIMQPDFVDKAMVEAMTEKLRTKKNPAALDLVRFERFTEGRAAQILHVGPFSEEGPTIARVHDYIQEMGCSLSGKHHEIYLSDIRRAAPEKWKTIIRQPFS